MQLRDHPLMTYHSASTWPPVWIGRYERDKTLRGEIGILTRIVQDEDPKRPRCYLYITHDGEPYIGSLLFEDWGFCRFIVSFLKNHYGERIEDIAALDISETL